jgi:two-component system OmpR family response regulator
MAKKRIFILDDDEVYLKVLHKVVGDSFDADVEVFTSSDAFYNALIRKPDIVVLDYYLGPKEPNKRNGMDVLKRMNEILPQNPQIIILSSQEEDSSLVFDFVQEGAFNYIIKDRDALQNLKETIKEII